MDGKGGEWGQDLLSFGIALSSQCVGQSRLQLNFLQLKLTFSWSSGPWSQLM